MPLFIRDDDVTTMAEELTRLTKARSKTEAVRTALRHELERTRASLPVRDRLARFTRRPRRSGFPIPIST